MEYPVTISKWDLFVLRVAAREWLRLNPDDPNAKEVEQALVNTNVAS